MRNYIKILLGVCLSLVIFNCYAIQVNVQSPSKQVAALGFTVNGKSHGGAGSSYSKKDMPTGVYTFGVRVGGVFGTDVGCTMNGRNSVNLRTNTTAVLNYDGQKCTMRMYSSIRY